ncbi:9123_t:CDS:1, partial [Dentiscutata erythropus]
ILLKIFNNWMVDLDDPNSKLNVQIKSANIENIAFTQPRKQSEAFYTSRFLNLSNLQKFDNLSQLSQPVYFSDILMFKSNEI